MRRELPLTLLLLLSYVLSLSYSTYFEANECSKICTFIQNLIYALEASLKNIVSGPVSLQDRFKLHREAAKKFRSEVTSLGFKTVALSEDACANGMTAVYVPEGVEPPKLIGALAERGIVIAGGLHKEIKTKYIRFGGLIKSSLFHNIAFQLTRYRDIASL